MCGTASGWAKMALVCIFIGMVLHIAGWASKNWMTYETSGGALEYDVGLWRQDSCTNGNCEETAVQSEFESDEFNAVRALETITFCITVFATIMMFIYVFVESARRRNVAIVLMVLCFLAGTLSFIGMIIWIVSIPDPFVISFSLGLTVIAYLLVLIAGVLLIPDVFEPYDSPYEHHRQRSDLVAPYSSRRHEVVTPISLGGPTSYRW